MISLARILTRKALKSPFLVKIRTKSLNFYFTITTTITFKKIFYNHVIDYYRFQVYLHI